MLSQQAQFDFDKASEAAELQALFGPPALLPAESPAEYWRLYSLFQADLAPADVIEKIWLRDLVDLQWEVRRWRRLNNALLSSSKHDGLDKILSSLFCRMTIQKGIRARVGCGAIQSAVAEVSSLLELSGSDRGRNFGSNPRSKT